jgi:hypothetical protein
MCKYTYVGMKSSFRAAVMEARIATGITDEEALTSTNAPASQMSESPDLVVWPEILEYLRFS